MSVLYRAKLAALVCVFPVTCVATGCHMIGGQASLLNDSQVAKATANDTATPANSFNIEFRSEGKKTEVKQAVFENDLHLQDVVDKSGARKKFNRFTIDLARNTPKGNRHTMAANYDRSAKRIEPQTDYAIRPGDTVIITEDKTTVIDDMLQNIGGPLGKTAKKRVSG